MNKKKINKIIAYATLCCALSTNIPNLVYAENKITVENNTNDEHTDTIITFNEDVTVYSLNKNSKESPVTFVDSNFEVMIRKALNLGEGEVIYQSTLDRVESIRFSIEENNITSLEDISKFTNLTSVTVYDNQNVDLSPIKLLANLKRVSLKSGTYDLSQLPMEQITELTIGNSIVDNSQLRNFTNLTMFEYVATDHDFVASLDFVDYLTNIDTLIHLKIGAYDDINSETDKLKKLTNLEKLEIANYSDVGVDLGFLSSLTKLKDVKLFRCDPSTIEILNDLTLLEKLGLNNSSITNDHLLLITDTLNRVNEIDLSDNKISKVEGLDTIFKDKEIYLNDNFIDLNSTKNKDFLDSKAEHKMYPQKRITTRESGRSFLLNIDESFDTDALAIESIEKDGSSRLSMVFDDDIEYYIAYQDNDFLTITDQNKLVGTKEGNATVHVRVKGAVGPTTSVTITISTTSKKENTGVVVTHTVNENNESIGDNQIARTYEKGTQIIVAPNVNYYYPIEGENIYKDVEVTSGSVNEVTFKYKRIDSNITDRGKIQVLYKDNSGREIADTEFKEYLSLSSHNINAKEIKGYTLTGSSTQTVTLTDKEPYKVVTFNYTKTEAEAKKGTLTVRCINDDTNEVISSKTEQDLSLGIYTRTAETLEGYTLVGENTKSINLTETLPNGVIEFRYTANKNTEGEGGENTPVAKGTISVKYKEKDTGNILLTEKVMNDLELKEYEILAEEIEGYELVGDSKVKVMLTSDKTSEEVIFTYKKVENNNNTDNNNNENGDIGNNENNGENNGGNGSENNGGNNSGNNGGNGSENNGGNNTEDSEIEAKAGTVTIYYIDSATKTEIANKEVKTGLELKDQIFTAKKIPGFTATTDSIKVALSEDVTSKEITFEYTNSVTTDDSAIFTLTPSLLQNYVDNDYSWSIASDMGGLTLQSNVLSKILNKTSDNISISFNDNLFNKEAYNNAVRMYDVNVLKTISILNNIPTLEDNTKVNLTTTLPGDYVKQDVYLYKVTQDGDLAFVDKKIAVDVDSDTAFASFEVDINQLNETDFIVSDSNLKLSDNSESNTNNNETEDEDKKDTLPDTSGSVGGLFGLSITSLLAGIKLRKK